MQTITMTSIAQRTAHCSQHTAHRSSCCMCRLHSDEAEARSRLTAKAERLDQLIEQANADRDHVMAQGYLAELADVMRSLRRIERGW